MMKNFKELIKKQNGAEILQVVLISGILLVLIVTLFYPQMQNLLNSMMSTITNWFNNSGSKIFTV